MEIQMAVKSDIAMALDNVPKYGLKKQDYAKSVDITTKWHTESKQHHDDKKQLLFGITQGGVYADLRKKSTEQLVKLDFDGYAIGGLSFGETKDEFLKALKASADLLPENKPHYLMGEGHPVQMLDSIERGMDIFDSAYPTRGARHHGLFTSQGLLTIDKGVYKKDQSALDPECKCYVCKNYTKAYIYHLSKLDEPNGKIFKTYHNVHFLTKLLEKARKAIIKDRFKEFKQEFLRSWGK
jgi:queuine tRNA-ribosyltransferase